MINDKIYNKFLRLRNFFNKNILRQRYGSYRINFSKCQLEIFDEFIDYNDSFWEIQEYEEDDFVIDKNNVKFTNSGLKVFNNDNKIGELRSKKMPMNYGIYEFNVEVPTTPLVNPKIKLVKDSDKKPKIYLFDYYVDEYSKTYISNSVVTDNGYRLRNNSCSGLEYNKFELKTYYINIKFVFDEKSLTFYMDNHKIRRITDKKTLNELINNNYNIVISNNLSHPIKNKKTTFKVKNFSFFSFN